MKLREYQRVASQKGREFFINAKAGDNSVIVMPTGAGKSLIIADIASNSDGATLVLQPSKEILEQNYEKTRRFGSWDIGIYSASVGEKKIRKTTFATIGSIYKKPELFSRFDNIIVDECHYVRPGDGMYAKFFEQVSRPTLGLTATPIRLHPPTSLTGATIKFITRTRPRYFKDFLHIEQIKDLYRKYDRPYLSPIKYTLGEYDSSQVKLNSTGAEFDDEAIQRYHRKINLDQRASKAVLDTPRKHFLVFAASLLDASHIVDEIKSIGFRAEMVSGKTPKAERERILSQFKAGDLKAVVNVGVLTTGFDFPELDCVILARPTNSLTLYYQMIGRGVRLSPETGKTECEVIDLCGNFSRFGRVDDLRIVEPEPGKHRMIKTGGDFITGVDLKDGRDLENDSPYKEQSDQSGLTINFGKFKGTLWAQLPLSYIQWIAQTFDAGSAKNFAVQELNRRGVQI